MGSGSSDGREVGLGRSPAAQGLVDRTTPANPPAACRPDSALSGTCARPAASGRQVPAGCFRRASGPPGLECMPGCSLDLASAASCAPDTSRHLSKLDLFFIVSIAACHADPGRSTFWHTGSVPLQVCCTHVALPPPHVAARTKERTRKRGGGWAPVPHLLRPGSRLHRCTAAAQSGRAGCTPPRGTASRSCAPAPARAAPPPPLPDHPPPLGHHRMQAALNG